MPRNLKALQKESVNNLESVFKININIITKTLQLYLSEFFFMETFNIFDIIQVLISFVCMTIAYYEYRKHVEQSRDTVLSEYNTRYCNDKNIEKVVKYLIWFMEANNYENEDAPDNPTIYEKEMFMRFFEELQMQVENGRIGDGKIEDFFAYYAVAAAMCPEFVKGTELKDGNQEIWSRYKAFVLSFPNLQKIIAEEYQDHNKGVITMEINIGKNTKTHCTNK